MPNQPNFQIPEVIDPPKTRCIQLQIPDDETWITNFVGILAQPMYWFNWQRTGDTSGKQCADVWTLLYDKIDWSNMSCCTEPLKRMNADGSISVSFDDGATWEDDKSFDLRYTTPAFPPVTGDDGDTKKCKAANSIVRQLKDQQISYSSQIGEATTVIAMASLLVAIAVGIFATAGLAAFLIAAFFELGAALLTTTTSAYNALFTDDDWSWILCEVYCKMDATGTIPDSEFVNITSDFDTHFSGNAALTFSSIMAAWQIVGLNNAARVGTTDNLDCSGCCPTCTSEWSIFDDTGGLHGSIVSTTDTTITVTSTVLNAGHYYLLIRTPDNSIGCRVTAFTIDHDDGLETGGSFVGETITVGAPNHFPVGNLVGDDCWAYIQIVNNVSFTAVLTMDAC